MENTGLDNHVVSVNIPTKSDYNDIAQESISSCTSIIRFNALNSALYCNCVHSHCANANKTTGKCIANGGLNASIMFVDAFPSDFESVAGAFTDEKGYLLNEILKDTKYKRSDLYCTNMIKCHNIQDTNADMICNCLEEYFYKEIDLVKPKKMILTYSAFQACLKYKIVPHMGNINYFTKIHTSIRNLEIDMYIVYDIKALTIQQRDAFKQGMKMILQ